MGDYIARSGGRRGIGRVSRLGVAISMVSPWSWGALTIPAVFAAEPAQAQVQPSAPGAALTLGDALAYADAHYPAVKAALSERAAAEREVTVARTAYLPRVDLLAQINRATVNNITGVVLPQQVIPSITGAVIPETGRSAWNSAGGVLGSWRVFDFGQRSAAVDVERQGAAAAAADYDLTRLDVAAATLSAYLNILASEALVVTAQANVDRLAAFGKAVRVLVDNKLRAGVEGAQADAALADAQARLLGARNDVIVQRATLSRLLGSPADNLALSVPAPPSNPEALFASGRAVTDHPAVVAAGARANQQRARVAVAARSFAPVVDVVGAAYGRGSGRDPRDGSGLGFNTTNWAAGVQVTFPLGAIPRAKAERSARSAELDAQRDRYDETVRTVNEKRDQARAGLRTAVAIASVVPAQVRAARDAEAQQRARFQSGLATAVDVTIAEDVLARAESQNAIVQLNLWRAIGAAAVADGDLSPVTVALTSR